jgi:hypothetical protein
VWRHYRLLVGLEFQMLDKLCHPVTVHDRVLASSWRFFFLPLFLYLSKVVAP